MQQKNLKKSLTSTLGNGIINTTSKLGKEWRIIMTREEILAKAHTDYKNNDPIELETRNTSITSITVGTLVGIILCMVLFVNELLISNQVDRGLWALVIAPAGA